jgi:hypothetical protein
MMFLLAPDIPDYSLQMFFAKRLHTIPTLPTKFQIKVPVYGITRTSFDLANVIRNGDRGGILRRMRMVWDPIDCIDDSPVLALQMIDRNNSFLRRNEWQSIFSRPYDVVNVANTPFPCR